jgi:hypothetical protein
MTSKARKTNFNQLFTVVGKIFAYIEEKQLVKDKEDFVKTVKCANRFVETFKELNEEDVDDLIGPIFTKYKDLLGTDVKVTTWLKDSGMSIDLSNKRRLIIDTIYEMALETKDHVKGQLKGLPKASYESRQELIYADILRLHLYRIIFFTAKKEERAGIAKQTCVLEEMLGISKERSVIPSDERSSKASGFEGLLEGEDNPMQGIMKIASTFMNNPKIKSALGKGDNSELNSETVGDILGGAFKDGDMQETLKNLMGGLLGNGGGDADEMLGNISKIFGNKEASEQLANLSKTLNIGGNEEASSSSGKGKEKAGSSNEAKAAVISDDSGLEVCENGVCIAPDTSGIEIE